MNFAFNYLLLNFLYIFLRKLIVQFEVFETITKTLKIFTAATKHLMAVSESLRHSRADFGRGVRKAEMEFIARKICWVWETWREKEVLPKSSLNISLEKVQKREI